MLYKMKKTLILFTLTSFISCGQHTEHTVNTVKKIQQLPTKTITNTPQSFSNVAKEIAIQTKVNDLPLQLIGKFTIPTYTNGGFGGISGASLLLIIILILGK